MSRQCPYLEYRREGDGQSFDHERPFCSVVGSFVQPMRADVCAGRHGLDYAAHCEYYRDHEGVDPLDALDPVANRAEQVGGSDDRPDNHPGTRPNDEGATDR